MRALLPLLFFLAQPFWEANPPEKWTDAQVEEICHNSPWAQVTGPSPEVLVYFATAAPIEEAETEIRSRLKKPFRDADPDYRAYITENRDRHFVVAIPYASLAKLGEAAEQKKLEQETLMIVGKKKIKMVGHFPPTESDPVLRFVFPREVQPTDKKVVFRFYLPGVQFPDREVEFPVKDLIYHGKLEM